MTINITKKSNEEVFVPHMAMTHQELNGGAANGINKPISLKSRVPLTKAALSAIEKLEGKDGLEKASYRNTQRMLESTIETNIKASLQVDYAYVWLKDFDENTAVFEYNDTLYGVDYYISSTGIVTLNNEIKEVVQQDVYVTEDGKSLVLKYKNSSKDSGETLNKGVSPDEGKDDMSVEQVSDLEKQIETLQKGQDDAIAQAVEKALAAQKQATEKAILLADTTQVVKGFEAVEEADQEALVKALVDMADDSVLVIKAMSDMQDAVLKAKEEKEEAIKSADTIKAEFASKDVGVEVPAGAITKGSTMTDAVSAAKARQAKKA